MANSRVGIVIPSYNQGKYIEAAILSVLANKRHIDLAVAVIDGGSQDETKDIISRYDAQLDVWCSEPDGGQACAINKGIRLLPECQYYMWLNSDDVYEDEYSVFKIVDFAEQNRFEVCYGKSHFIDETGSVIGDYPVEGFSYENLGKRCYLSQPSVLFSRKAYADTGGINEELKMCLDYEYWIRLAQEYRFGFVDEYIGSTRMYAGTKTSMMQQQHLKEAFSILMKYYGDVPMHWIVTKVLADHPYSIWHIVPRRLLILAFRPLKRKIIRESLKGGCEC